MRHKASLLVSCFLYVLVTVLLIVSRPLSVSAETDPSHIISLSGEKIYFSELASADFNDAGYKESIVGGGDISEPVTEPDNAGILPVYGLLLDSALLYTIGGFVQGLTDEYTVVLQNNSGDDLLVLADSIFVFDTALKDGLSYVVTTAAPLKTPSPICTVAGGRGTVAGADVTDIAVICVPPPKLTCNISAEPATVELGSFSTLSWSSNAESCTIVPEIGTDDCNGSITVSPAVTTSYTLTATDPGGTLTQSTTVTVVPVPQPVITFSSEPAVIEPEGMSTLTWNVSNAESCTIAPEIGPVDCNGSIPVSPVVTTSYTLTATGLGDTVTQSTTVTVVPVSQPVITFSSEPAVIAPEGMSTLSWNVSNVESCSIAPEIGAVDCNGSIPVSPAVTTSYILTAIGPGGTLTQSTTVTVVPVPQPVITFSSEPAVIAPEGMSTLSWNVSNAESCSIAPGVGPVDCNGSIPVSPAVTTSYALTAIGPGGTLTQSTTVTVVPVVSQPVITFSSEPAVIAPEGMSILSWNVINAESCTIAPEIGPVDCNGSITVSPAVTTSYTLTAIGLGDTLTQSTTVTVVPVSQPVIIFSSEPAAIVPEGMSTLSWNVINAESCTIAPEIGPVDCDGSITVSPTVTTSYTLTAISPGGTVVASATVTPYKKPVVWMEADPFKLYPSSKTAVLRWRADYAESCSMEYSTYGITTNIVRFIPCRGDFTMSPDETTTYYVTATGPGGTSAESVTIDVLPYGPPTAVITAVQVSSDPVSEYRLTWSGSDFKHGCELSITGEETREVDCNDSIIVEQLYKTVKYRIKAWGYHLGANNATASVTVPGSVGLTSVITAEPAVIDVGGSSTLTWSSTGADVCTLAPDIGIVDCNGSMLISPTVPTTYSLKVSKFDQIGEGGYTSERTIVGVTFIEPTVSISVVPDPANPDVSRLHWTSTNGVNCTLEPDVGTVDCNGSMVIDRSEVDKTYIITVAGFGASAFSHMAEASVLVPGAFTPGLTVSIDVESPPNYDESPYTLIWNSSNASSCSIEPDIGDVDCNGSTIIFPEASASYTITAIGLDGNMATASTTVGTDSPAGTLLSINASPQVVKSGETMRLFWNSKNIHSLGINNDFGCVAMPVATAGSIALSPKNSSRYCIYGEGPTGHLVSSCIHVYVNQKPVSEGMFGYRYNHLIPDDSWVDPYVASYDENAFSLITGLVEDSFGPLAGAVISIKDTPSYGTATTDAQGMFSIPVNGGGIQIVEVRKDGYLRVHRKIDVDKNDYGVVDTIQMTPEDTEVTEVIFDGNVDTIIGHRSSIISDDFGSRSALMVFTGNNKAFQVDKTGNDTREISSFVMRTTESSVGKSMIAALPANTALAYGVELHADGVELLRFEKPFAVYVDNFLGFDVGETVPVGYYDRETGRWIPQDNGVVVTLLDSDNDTIVDGIDSDGDGIADDLNSNNDTRDEAAGLNGLTAGDSYMRFTVTQSGTWVCSWPHSRENMENVYLPAPFLYDSQNCPGDDCTLRQENIPIPGTDISLHYSESRVAGYRPVIKVPVTETTLPSGLSEIRIQLRIGGRLYSRVLFPVPDQVVEFQWDGMDFLGNDIEVPVTARISVGYVFSGLYQHVGNYSQGFGQNGNGSGVISSREPYIVYRNSKLTLARHHKSDDFIGSGWTLSAQHQVDVQNKELVFPGGGGVNFRDQLFINNLFGGARCRYDWNYCSGYCGDIVGLAGRGGTYCYSSGGSDTLWATFSFNPFIVEEVGRVSKPFDVTPYGGMDNPNGIIVNPDPELGWIVAETDRHRLVYLKEISTHWGRLGDNSFACSGVEGYSGDGGPALDAQCSNPTYLSADVWGNIFFIDSGNNVIRKISASGLIETVAGNGTQGSSGDGGSALDAAITPTDIAVDHNGNLYITEWGYYRVRKVDIENNITTIIGTGEQSSREFFNEGSGDGGPAEQALLRYPTTLAVDSSGFIYLADSSRIRMVSHTGEISTIAGGSDGYSGNGGLARDARFRNIKNMNFDDEGNLLVADYENCSARIIGGPSLVGGDNSGFSYTDQENTYIFSGLGKHLETENKYDFIYNSDNQLIGIRDTDNSTILLLLRDPDGKPESIVTAGSTIDLRVDENKHLTDIEFQGSGSLHYGYDENGIILDSSTSFPDLQISLQAEPQTVVRGEASQLSWQVDNAYSCELLPSIGIVPCTGTMPMAPDEDIDYTMHAVGYGGTGEMQVSVSVVDPVPTAEFSADTTILMNGQTATLSWQSSCGTEISMNNGIGIVAAAGSLEVSPDVTTTYTLTVSNDYGTVSRDVTITVSNVYPQIQMSGSRSHISAGEEVTLSWQASHADTCLLTPETGIVDCSGAMTVSPQQTTRYRLSAEQNGIHAHAAVVITVDSPYGNPGMAEQAHLEAINRARANPGAEANRLGIELNEGVPADKTIVDQYYPPLTFNELLYQAARGHSQDMVDSNSFSHTGSDGSNPSGRCQAAGYGDCGENISGRSSSEILDPMATALTLHDNLFIDLNSPVRSNRVKILSSTYSEVGVGYIHESSNSSYAHGGVVTDNFGTGHATSASLLGTVYNDINEDGAYSSGEALEGVSIAILETGEGTTTFAAGGYGMFLVPGQYTLLATLPDGRSVKRVIEMTEANLKEDFTMADFADVQPFVFVQADPAVIAFGASTTLTWQSFNSEYLHLDHGYGYIPLSGSLTVTPDEDPYIFTATGYGQSVTHHFTVRTHALVITQPADNSTVLPATAAITVIAGDSSINTVIINGQAAVVEGNSFRIETVLTPGKNLIIAAGYDAAGNLVARKSISINSDMEYIGPIAKPLALPSSGPAPLVVALVADGLSGSDPLVRYQWDLDNDSVFDTDDNMPRHLRHVFNEPGSYEVKLAVEDSSGKRHITSRHITVTEGEIQAPVPAEDPTITLAENDIDLSAPEHLSFALSSTLAENDIDLPVPEPSSFALSSILPQDTFVAVTIEDLDGNLLRHLNNPFEYRSTGEYVDYWNCLTNEGDLAPNGLATAILTYVEDGEVKTIQLHQQNNGDNLMEIKDGRAKSLQTTGYEDLLAEDPYAAGSLIMTIVDKGLIGTVGKNLDTPVMIQVTTTDNSLVQNVPVELSILSGGGSVGSSQQSSVIIHTNIAGMAVIPVTLPTLIESRTDSLWLEGKTYPSLVQKLQLEVRLIDNPSMRSSFIVYALPDVPAKLVWHPLYSGHTPDTVAIWNSAYPLSPGNLVQISVEDQYGNPCANAEVLYEMEDDVTLWSNVPITSYVCDGSWDSTEFLLPDLAPPLHPGMIVPLSDTCIAANNGLPIYDHCRDLESPARDTRKVLISGSSGMTSAYVLVGSREASIYGMNASIASGDSIRVISKSALMGNPSIDHMFDGNQYATVGLAVDTRGHVYAGRLGETLALTVKVDRVEEGQVEGDTNTVCFGTIGDGSCVNVTYRSSTLGNSEFSREPMNNALVHIGENAVAPDGTDGMYTLNYQVPDSPGYEKLKITAEGDFPRSYSFYDCDEGVTAVNEYNFTFIDNISEYAVHAVDIINDSEIIIPIDENGRVTNDIAVSFNILPSDYSPSTSSLFFYKTETGQDENMASLYLGQGTDGNYEVIIPAGSYFDPDEAITYEAGIILDKKDEFLITGDGQVIKLKTIDNNTEVIGDRIAVTLVQMDMVPDYNRDGTIDDKDRGLVTTQKPWRFWVNDDDDDSADEKGIGGNDLPGSGADLDNQVNGIRDLVDFFPLYLDLQEALTELSPEDGYTYRLKHEGAALAIVEGIKNGATLTTGAANAYLEILSTGNHYKDEAVSLVTADGISLTPEFLDSIRNNTGGIILVEGRGETAEPLQLEIVKDGKVIVPFEFPLEITGVEQMFGHRDLRPVAGGEAKVGDRFITTAIAAQPYCMQPAEQSMVWIHGYNTDPDAATATFAEVFKRFFHAGMNGSFYGVSWFGDPYAPVAPHYHQAVVNAFATANAYADFVRMRSRNGTVVLAAHSLGNLVVGAAIQDHNLTEFHRYFAVDAAVALEAYGQVEPVASSMMKVNDWLDYWNYEITDANNKPIHPAQKLLASEWNTIFDAPDQRHTLTWRNRLAKVPTDKVYNFYSSTEDVLREYEDDGLMSFLDTIDSIFGGGLDGVEEYLSVSTWVKQEKFKGRRSLVNAADNFGGCSSRFGGWMFDDENWRRFVPGNSDSDGQDDNYELLPPDEITHYDDWLGNKYKPLQEKPFFEICKNSGTICDELSALTGTPEEANSFLESFISSNVAIAGYYDYNVPAHSLVTVRDWLLAEAFPATTLPMGANKNGKIDDEQEVNMSAEKSSKGCKTSEAEWPRPDDFKAGEGTWKHSDYIEIPYQHVHEFYKKIKMISVEGQ